MIRRKERKNGIGIGHIKTCGVLSFVHTCVIYAKGFRNVEKNYLT